MSARSHKADLVILLALGALVVGTLLALTSWGWMRAQEDRLLGVRSTHAAGPEGTMAWYLLLERLGYDVRRSEEPLHPGALAGADVLVLVDPSHRLEEGEADALKAWVRRGGVLVCANATNRVPWDLHRIGPRTHVRSRADDFLGDGPRGRSWSGDYDQRSHVPRQSRLPLARDVTTVRMAGPGAIGESEPSEAADEGSVEILFADAERSARPSDRARVAARPVGRGRVLFLADSSFLANGRLGEEDNAVLAVNLAAYALARAPGRRLAFDEYHFGFGARPSGGSIMATMLLGTGPGRAVLVMTGAGLLYLVYRGRRFGTRRPAAAPPRRSKLEYVQAVGSTYRAAGAHRLALDLLFRHVRRQAVERAGLRASATVAEVADGLARVTGRPAARYATVLGTCEEAVADPQRLSARRLASLLAPLADLETEIMHEPRAGH